MGRNRVASVLPIQIPHTQPSSQVTSHEELLNRKSLLNRTLVLNAIKMAIILYGVK